MSGVGARQSPVALPVPAMSRSRIPLLPSFGIAVGLALMCASSQAASLASSETDTEADTADTWLGVFDCLRAASPATCLQSRAVRAFEQMLPDDDEPEADKELQLREAEVGGVRLPQGVSPAVGRVIERIGDLIASGLSQWIPEETDVESAKSANDIEDQARGKKKKVKKAIKKAILKLIIVGLLIKQKIKMLLMAAQTFLQFKFLLLATVYVISNIVKIWLDIKAQKHPQKVIYYENAHHQHHYEPEHHDFDEHEHGGGGGWGGLWGRSIVATEPTASRDRQPPHPSPASAPASYDYPRSLAMSAASGGAHELAYSAHAPTR